MNGYQLAIKVMGTIRDLQWADVCETMLKVFYRTRRDENYDAILAYIVENKVSEQISNFMQNFDANHSVNDGTLKALQTLLETLGQWEKEVGRPVPKPLLFIFDSVTLNKVLTGKKTALITLKLNWDIAGGQGPSGMRTYFELRRDKSSNDKVKYKRGEIYPIFEEGNDTPAGYVKLFGLDKDEIDWLIRDDPDAIRNGFSGDNTKSPLEQFKVWWNGNHTEDNSYEKNPKVWILRFSVLEDDSQDAN
jgi:hypothetical protein